MKKKKWNVTRILTNCTRVQKKTRKDLTVTLDEIKAAVLKGEKVHWAGTSYTVIVDNLGQFLIQFLDGHCICLTWRDDKTLNGKEADFFISGSTGVTT